MGEEWKRSGQQRPVWLVHLSDKPLRQSSYRESIWCSSLLFRAPISNYALQPVLVCVGQNLVLLEVLGSMREESEERENYWKILGVMSHYEAYINSVSLAMVALKRAKTRICWILISSTNNQVLDRSCIALRAVASTSGVRSLVLNILPVATQRRTRRCQISA